MPLTLSIEELFTLHVEARLNPENGAISFNFRPSPTAASTLMAPTGFRVHFETIVDSNGVNVLTISASPKECEWSQQSSYDGQAVCPTASGSNQAQHFSHEPTHADVICMMSEIYPQMSLPGYQADLGEESYSTENNVVPVFDCISETPHFEDAGDVQTVSFGYPDSQIQQNESMFYQSHVPHDVSSAPEYDHPSPPPISYQPSQEVPLPVFHDVPSAPEYRPPSPPTTASSPTPSIPTSDSSYNSIKPAKAVKPRVPCLHPDCDRHFKNDYTRSLHMKAHIVKRRRYPCSRCPLVLSRQHDRMRHEVSKHDVVPQFACPHCRKSFGSERNMIKHKCPSMYGIR
ncbi:hypothetical protein C8R43DRAFT_180861 [Mycena crocata]|nr:hypothetical protein C8R43DRAFT_180861 [Mycena crocata]